MCSIMLMIRLLSFVLFFICYIPHVLCLCVMLFVFRTERSLSLFVNILLLVWSWLHFTCYMLRHWFRAVVDLFRLCDVMLGLCSVICWSCASMCMCCMFILQGHIGGLTWCSRDRFTGIASLVTFICSHASPMKAACCLVFHIREVHMSHAHSMLAVFVDVSHAIAEVHFDMIWQTLSDATIGQGRCRNRQHLFSYVCTRCRCISCDWLQL